MPFCWLKELTSFSIQSALVGRKRRVVQSRGWRESSASAWLLLMKIESDVPTFAWFYYIHTSEFLHNLGCIVTNQSFFKVNNLGVVIIRATFPSWIRVGFWSVYRELEGNSSLGSAGWAHPPTSAAIWWRSRRRVAFLMSYIVKALLSLPRIYYYIS